MKSFVEFLAERQVLQIADIAAAVIKIGEQTPPVQELIRREELLSSQQLQQLLTYQAKKQVGWEEACRKLGFWRDGLPDALTKACHTYQPSLLALLFAEGKLPLEGSTAFLDEYIAEIQAEHSKMAA